VSKQLMAKTKSKDIKKQRSLKNFRDFKPFVKYYDKISTDIKKLPKFEEEEKE